MALGKLYYLALICFFIKSYLIILKNLNWQMIRTIVVLQSPVSPMVFLYYSNEKGQILVFMILYLTLKSELIIIINLFTNSNDKETEIITTLLIFKWLKQLFQISILFFMFYLLDFWRFPKVIWEAGIWIINNHLGRL